MDYPAIDINVDRSKAGQVGLTQRDVATSLLISLSSSGQIAPTQFLDWRTGVSYGVAVQTPQYRMDSLDALLRTPISAPFSGVNTTTATSTAGSANPTNAGVGAGPNQASAAYGNPGAASGGPQLLSNMVTVGRSVAPAIVNHYNVQPVMDVYANVDRRDLGSVGAGVEKIIAEMTPKLPRGTTIELRGQITTMQNSFYRLGLGMIFAVVLVYLLMAVNFQSWMDPFIILMALPGRAGRYRLDAVHHPDHVQRALPDGLHHVHRRGHREQHSAGGLRQRSARGGHGRALRGAFRRDTPASAPSS